MLTLAPLRAAVWRASMLGLARGPHLTRYSMYRRLEELGRALPDRTGRVLAISNSENLCDLLGLSATETVCANYPDENLLNLTHADDSFDFVLSDQVLEHIAGDPQRAIDESRRVLRPGGIAVHTTCFINPIHGYPHDYWRFTPEALRLLCRGFSEVIACEGWGNFHAWRVIRDGLRYDGVPHARWHPLHWVATYDDARWPIVTWIIARK